MCDLVIKKQFFKGLIFSLFVNFIFRKAELYVATQKETAAIIGKLLRMEFHHPLLSIEVVRKDTGGIEEGDESKKECKGMSVLIF